jgi:hypothetical protein
LIPHPTFTDFSHTIQQVSNVIKLSPPGPPKGGEKSKIPPFGGPKSAVNLMTLVSEHPIQIAHFVFVADLWGLMAFVIVQADV